MKQKKRQPEQLGLSPTSAPKPALESKSFSDHIGELRRRAFFVAIVFLVASALAYNYRDLLVELIMKPLGDEKLIYLTPGGGFNFIFQVTLYAGLIAAAPMLIYQLYGFIRPALPSRAQRSSGKVVIAAFLLMACGVAFGYFVAVPSALNFLSTFAGADIAASLTADSYLGFFLAYIAGLGVLFQLPLLLLFFHWIHPMTPGKLLKSERFVILFAFVASAIITPTPDVLNQSMIAVPLIAIYQLGVIVVLLGVYKDHRRHRKLDRVPNKQAAARSIAAATDLKPAPLARQPQLAKQMKPPAGYRHPVMPKVQSIQASRPRIDGFMATPRTAQVRPVVPPARHVSQPLARKRPVSTPYKRQLSIDGFMMG